MNTEKFFTDDEKILFFSKYRILRRALAESLEHDDPQKIRRLLRPVAAVDCYGRDRNGINGLLRNVETALIAAVDIGLKRAAVIALILYRPVLKKAVALEDVERAFGHDTALIIDRLLKTSDLYARNTAAGSENFHRLLFAFAEDVRVILIMIADRLCLMRMGKSLRDENDRRRLATEVSYLYAPLAHRLGLYRIKSELEDLSLKYLDPAQYYYIRSYIPSNSTFCFLILLLIEWMDLVRPLMSNFRPASRSLRLTGSMNFSIYSSRERFVSLSLSLM